MRLLGKLLIICLFLSFVPLAVASAFMVSTFNSLFSDQVVRLHSEQLGILDERLGASLDQAKASVEGGLTSFRLIEMSPEERQGVLRLIYRQVDSLVGIALVHPDAGLVAPPVYLTQDQLEGPFSQRTPLQPGRLESFILEGPKLPRDGERGGWGDPQFLPDYPLPLLPLWIEVGDSGLQGVALFDANPLLTVLNAFYQEHGRSVFLADEDGVVLVGLDATREGPNVLPENGPIPKGLWEPVWTNPRPGTARWGTEAGEQLASYADLTPLNLKLISLTPYLMAMEPIKRMQVQLRYWLLASVVIAAIFAVFFAQSISGPIELLSKGVRQIGAGNYDQRVELSTKDEIGQLAYNFNRMSKRLGNQRDEIARQQAEIQTWNEELQVRVDERTKELKEAQDYLVHTGKLAAVAELGSGVAHELNNPLAVVLGFAQILRARHSAEGDPEGPMISRIEEQAQRCKDIVFRLLSFSQTSQSQESTDRFDLTQVVRGVFTLFEGYFSSRKVTIDDRLPEGLGIHGDRDKLKQAVLQLVTAIRSTIPQGGALVLSGAIKAQAIEVRMEGTLGSLAELNIGDELSSLSVTLDRDQALSQGLGLWLAQKIVGEHGGLIRLESASGGTVLSLTLPLTPPVDGEGSQGESDAKDRELSV